MPNELNTGVRVTVSFRETVDMISLQNGDNLMCNLTLDHLVLMILFVLLIQVLNC
jgi:hypothetical protein